MKRSGTKKRSKQVEIGADSDDDEPIGSMFKLRRSRNSKKVSSALEGTGDRVQNAEPIGKKVVTAEEDSGGMDDTLASFRKRLKGPRRDQGSGTTGGKNSALNVFAGSSLDVSSEGGVLVNVNQGQVVGDNGSDMTMDITEAGSSPGKIERPHIDLALKGSEGHATSDDKLAAQGSRNTLKEEKGMVLLPADGLQQSSDEQKEDSLSAIFQNAQSNLNRKSHNASSLKQKSGSQILNDELSPVLKSVPETVLSMAERRSKSASASNLGKKILKCANDVPQGSDSHSFASPSLTDNKKFGGGCLQVQEESSKGICDSTIQNGLAVDHLLSTNVCNRDSQQLSSVQLGDVCSLSHQKVTFQERIVSDGLKQCSMMLHGVEVMADTALLSEVKEGVCGFSEGKVKKTSTDKLPLVCDDSTEKDVLTSMEKEMALPPPDSQPLNRLCESLLNASENNQLVSGNVLDGATKNAALEFSGLHAKVDGGVKSENELVSGGIFSSCIGLDMKAELQDFVSSFSMEKNAAISDGNSPPMTSNEAEENKLAVQSNHLVEPLENCVFPTDSIASIQKCSSVLHQIQPSNDTSEEGSLPNDDGHCASKGADGTSPSSAIPEQNENYTEYAASGSDFSIKDDKMSAAHRAMRKAKKRRHGDMAYEGDADWEILINDQSFYERQGIVDDERTLRPRVKLDSSLNVVEESESAAAAVSAGLKAHAAGPVEKIRFKEILKRKGGLQDYLYCRSDHSIFTVSLHLLAIGIS